MKIVVISFLMLLQLQSFANEIDTNGNAQIGTATTSSIISQYPECFGDKRKQFLQNYVNQSNMLGDQLVLFRRQESNAIDPDKNRKIVIQRRDIEDEITHLDRSFLAHMYQCSFPAQQLEIGLANAFLPLLNAIGKEMGKEPLEKIPRLGE